MFEKANALEVNQDEMDVIEAALHTQSKILSVQANAGGQGARRRLNDVKRLLARVAQSRPSPRVEKAQRLCDRFPLMHWICGSRTIV